MKVSQVRAVAGAIVSAGVLVATGSLAAQDTTAQSKAGVSDAQIESNVLKALASAPELSTQNIQTSTVFGTVTITGNVHDEPTRSKAENLVARAPGVKKVVDELTLGDTPAQPAEEAQGGAPDQGDAPEMANMAPVGPEAQGQLPPDQQYGPAGQPGYPHGQPGYPQGQQPYPAAGTQQPGGTPYGNPNYPPQGYPAQGGPGYPPNGPQYSQQGPPPGYYPETRRPMRRGYAPYPAGGGQQAGMPVTIAPGAPLEIRINRGIDSQHIKPGTPFDGIVLNDVAADGAIAIPRGASVQGVVVDAAKTKELSGQGQLSLQITSVSLGGEVYPVQTDVWHRVGADKTASTVNHAVGLGALGAVIGAVAGGGAGAAIGAGVGAGAGVATSAGGPGGRVLVPPESILHFHLAAPAEVRTVSQEEMQRLAYNAGPGRPAPRPYYARPGYYPYGGVYYYGR